MTSDDSNLDQSEANLSELIRNDNFPRTAKYDTMTKHGLAIEQTFGGHDGRPYTPDAPRATFWARKAGGEWI
jgi:hypothetical protein